MSDAGGTSPADGRARLRIGAKSDLLGWTTERSGRSAGALSRNQGMRRIREWPNGGTRPTLCQLEGFAGAAFVPLGCLFISDRQRDTSDLAHLSGHRDDILPSYGNF